MRSILPLLAVAALAPTAGLHAQTVPDDQWHAPSGSATTGAPYRSQPALAEDGPGAFKFRDRRPELPPAPPSPIPGQRANAMGAPAWDGDGRPKVDCAQTPNLPACH